jgi:hypothetical protein
LLGFHLSNSDLFQIIDNLCLEHEKKRTDLDFDEFLNHINEKINNPTTMQGTNKIFDLIRGSKIVKKTYYLQKKFDLLY